MAVQELRKMAFKLFGSIVRFIMPGHAQFVNRFNLIKHCFDEL